VVWRQHKYILHTGSGEEELYDIQADPGEQDNLAATTDTTPYQQALGDAHGVPVRPGLRLFVDFAADQGPVTVTFPGPVAGADVLDPEASLTHRANLEWGESPKKVASEVGQVVLAADKGSLVFTPGEDPEGVIWVQTQDAIDPEQVTLEPADAQVRVEAGPVLVPPPGEMTRMRALRGDSSVDEAEMDRLRELGYIH